MPLKIEDYALIGDCQAAALVGRDGSIDWLCLPRFDSGACFAALLGRPDHGRWLLAPAEEVRRGERRYRDRSLVLETDLHTDSGAVRIIDCMPPRSEAPDVVRIVAGLRGRVRMRMEMIIRFDYGAVVPWVRKVAGGISAIAGPDMLRLLTEVPLRGEHCRTVAEFDVAEGQRIPFVLTWYPSHHPEPKCLDAEDEVLVTDEWWRNWSGRGTYDGSWPEAVNRSLITLKALTYAPTGGIVAAPTTSLPEQLGGIRNWDYRFCWLRDATFTLYALMLSGYGDEARAWRRWLLRAVAGQPEQVQIMYGLAGERRLPEFEIPWLPGYENSCPVRIGNAASRQFQLDVYGEVLDALHLARDIGLEMEEGGWRVGRVWMDFLDEAWRRPDSGIWEMRGAPRHFTHSKVMAWVAFDRAVKAVERFGLDGPADRWRVLRDAIRREVLETGYDPDLGSFVQAYGEKALDASLLMIPLVGFLPATDPRMRGTVAAIERRLLHDGFVHRYDPGSGSDGLPPGEGVFLPCSFWLADNYYLMGRQREARDLFERLLDLRNDVGLLSEEYDPKAGRQVGNFPQAFTHVSLVNSAHNLHPAEQGPAEHRQKD